MHNMCIRSFTSQTMQDEAKTIEREKLKNKGKSNKVDKN